MNSTATPTPTVADRVRDIITTYVSLPDESIADMLALYVLHTHTFVMQVDDETKHVTLSPSSPRTTPYIYITSQGPGSGKTRLMELMAEICRSSQLFAGMTGPTMFRIIEAIRPTLFLDEVDTIYSGSKNEELRGVLNSGYKHNGRIPRVDTSSQLGFRDFSTFCPKVLAGIDNGNVPNTVLDRSIVINLVKAAPGTVQPFYSDDIEELALEIGEEIATWYAANAPTFADRTQRPAPIEGLSDRQNDIIRPLLAIADTLDGWSKRARVALTACFADRETPLTPQAEALSKVRNHMMAHGLTRISSAKVEALVGQNPKQIGAWFAAFEITPKTLRGFHKDPESHIPGQEDKAKGYLLTGSMEEAWNRYLPTLPTNI